MHEHEWTWITGRMDVKCDKDHWHEVEEGYDFEACWCGETRGERPYKCQRPYWLFITTEYCPQCGSTKVYKERRYTDKPLAWERRHEDIETWDYCGI